MPEFNFVAVKAIGEWELDVLAIPFIGTDADRQYFDAKTEIMHETFQTPLIAYQHGVAKGGKGLQDVPVVIGKAVPNSWKKQSDGWHIRVVLDSAKELAQGLMQAARKGLAAVSSGSISHLARLEVGGKLIQYEKNRPGRIAVWPVAEISIWDKGNGNFSPASQFATALPVMKAMYREAGIPFPAVSDTTGVLAEALAVKRRAEIRARAIEILEKTQDI